MCPPLPPLTQTEYRRSLKCVRGARSLEIGAIYFNLKMYLALKVAFEDCLARKKYFRPLLMIIGAITSLIYMYHPPIHTDIQLMLRMRAITYGKPYCSFGKSIFSACKKDIKFWKWDQVKN